MSDLLKGLFGGGDDAKETAAGIAGDAAHAAEDAGHDAERAARKAERAARKALSPEERKQARQNAQNFVDRYHDGHPAEGYSDQEALANFLAVTRGATPDQVAEATRMAVANLPTDQRAEFNQMLQQRQQGTGMVDIQRSGQIGQGNPGGGAPAAGSLDDVFGGLLGGLLGAGQPGGAAQSAPSGQIPNAGSLGDLFEQMMQSGDAQVYTWSGSPGDLQKQTQEHGGGLGGFINTMMQSGQPAQPGQAGTFGDILTQMMQPQGGAQPAPQGGGLGDILGQVLGGGQAQPAPQQGGGLGDILGQVLGGGQAQPAPQPQPQPQAQQGGGLFSSPVTKAVLGGVAAILMKQMLNPGKKA